NRQLRDRRGGHHRRNTGGESLSDDRAQGHRPDLAHQAPDFRGLGHTPGDLSGGLEHRPYRARRRKRSGYHQALTRNQGRGRRRHGAGGAGAPRTRPRTGAGFSGGAFREAARSGSEPGAGEALKRMDMSSNPLTPDARAVERLPYAFAKRHGVISARQLETGFEIWVRPGVRAGVLAEVQRALGGPLALRELASDAFDAALARAYERGASHAADIVTDLDANPDLAALAENLPKVADLLESEDDAPIVRLLNALFSQAVRPGASDIHIEAFQGRSVVR